MTEPLQFLTSLDCAASHAFNVFTQKINVWWPPGHRRFEGSELFLEPKIGGQFFERAQDGTVAILGAVFECAPPDRICFTWNPGKISGPTRVTVSFTQEGSRTQVAVLHEEGDADLGAHWETRAALFKKGWNTVLPALQTYIQKSSNGKG